MSSVTRRQFLENSVSLGTAGILTATVGCTSHAGKRAGIDPVTLDFVVRRYANFYHFVSHLAEVLEHQYRKAWLEETGPLSSAEEPALANPNWGTSYCAPGGKDDNNG